MKIERIDVYHVAMPMVAPFRVAFADIETIESVLVRMTSGGLEGWGEAASLSLPLYSPEYAAGVFALVRDVLAKQVVGKDIAGGQQLQDILTPIRGNQFAKAGLDLAWWDLYARQRNEPLWKTIGGRGPEVPVGADFGVLDSIDELLRRFERAMEAGFARIKLKYRPGWELDMVRAVRKRFPDTVIHVDCNSAYRLENLDMLKALDEFHLAMIEQPLANDDIVDHAELRRQIRTPICLDESANSPDNCAKAIRIGACDWINIKHGRVGGLANALKIHDLCKAAGVGNWIGGMLDSAIGQAFATALATLDNVKYPSDIFPSERFYREDLGEPPIVFSGRSMIRAAEGPGIGVRPNPKRLKEMTVRKAILKA